MNTKHLLTIGGALSGLGVCIGAFAAHGLKKLISAQMVEVFQTGVHYQFIHSAALLVCGVLLALPINTVNSRKYFCRAAICFIIGIFCFSGSLYALALTSVKWFGPITPLGGVFFIVGWIFFVLAALKLNEVTS
ncbi:DUF423 domain-containing protein [Vibrio palustris]|uniref:Inner membrane protein YgdD n=1 Tax=Vibrio palustris TaxID=1918946 RepID=A0A1R4B184_9VIBR|nr:DUF423 domain-containing protein [Vibrio palustris]SJL82674.1 hypothetical protein VPAL9027_00607 [Vibrio palustris]